MSDDSFNGWKNYATHTINTAFCSNTELNQLVRLLAGKFKTDEELAGALESLCEKVIDKGFSHDRSELSILRQNLLGCALLSVDWQAIAKAWRGNE